MISRATTKELADIYGELFTVCVPVFGIDTLDAKKFYDYLYEKDYRAWFINLFEKAMNKDRFIKVIMQIHTGETLHSHTKNWEWKKREQLGQQYLKKLAEDIIEYCEVHKFDYVNDSIDELKSKLELDGYIWKNKKLLFSESDVLDVEEEEGILRNLVDELSLENIETAFHHLEQSRDHYVNKKWDDSISNSRKFLESILQEVAAKHHFVTKNKSLSNTIYGRPKEVRSYLEKSDLFEEKEIKVIASVYGLLSETGGHPYIAEQDQARLLRHLALTLCQFVLLRVKGYLKSK